MAVPLHDAPVLVGGVVARLPRRAESGRVPKGSEEGEMRTIIVYIVGLAFGMTLGRLNAQTAHPAWGLLIMAVVVSVAICAAIMLTEPRHDGQ